MRLIQLVVLIVLLVPVAACSNLVVSETPWFPAAAIETGPLQRPGVWLSEDVHCKVNAAAPVERWPICVQWWYQRGRQHLSPQWIEKRVGRHRVRTYGDWSASEDVIVGGDPMIIQSQDCPRELRAAPPIDAVTDNPDRVPPAHESEPQVHNARFCYGAMRATAFDAKGRITAVEVWPVLCGPFRRNDGTANDELWPGLSRFGDNCVAASEAALRDAAKRSGDIAHALKFVGRARWIRYRYR